MYLQRIFTRLSERDYGSGYSFTSFSLLDGVDGGVLEPVAVIAGFDDVVMMREPIQQCGGEFCVTEDGSPFREAQVGSDYKAGFLA